MASGPKRHRITIERDDGTTRAANGEHIVDWTDLGTYWAEGGPLEGRELLAAREVQSEITHRYKIRYGQALSDLTGDVRLTLHSGKVFHVIAALNLGERNKEWQLDCKQAPDTTVTAVPPDFYGW